MPGNTFYIWTVGCQMNVADSRRAADALKHSGYKETNKPSEADVIILNTCSVRESAERRTWGKLGALSQLKRQRPDTIIVMMGCMVHSDTALLHRQFPLVDHFVPAGDIDELLASIPPVEDEWGTQLYDLSSASGVTAFVPVIMGCNKFCTFCVVPYRRGRERSIPIPDVVEEVRFLADRGVKEVTLLGQTINHYGKDLPNRPDLADLLYAVHEVPGIERIRFLTSYPRTMTDKILHAVADLPKVCEHINIPFQAGDNDVLRAMRRGYTIEQYIDLIDRVRSIIPGVSIATDIIVGFPNETEEKFQKTYDVLEQLRLDQVHIACYSPRPGTKAYEMGDPIPLEEKQRRFRILEEQHERISAEINKQLEGTIQEVLFEEKQKGKWKGRTRTNKLVFVDSEEDLTGKTLPVRITHTTAWSMQAELVDSPALKIAV
ncbi:RNA modification enzyme, MiaB family [Thermobaculum terrenum ATCC BAA-798]|uniref:tRNA-2-methylthio-N(6)-dimethylallyladenosine synthase n=1 Tax=Thermobaculum terrenum (strain ATCC BAA-798 / CCMEE 7001 / YNP1) TaxID=525904 RepID=D1CG24_THET1|nr:tRNA (N6-isopentenyl adenosine(37)-C2)-methylthiotransferase MiaB [Thermobaculum terrenum]ACZ41880.1 RNA modification enzyme, MiaB family [Thermobaculum terrenum ATCC BAA-798]